MRTSIFRSNFDNPNCSMCAEGDFMSPIVQVIGFSLVILILLGLLLLRGCMVIMQLLLLSLIIAYFTLNKMIYTYLPKGNGIYNTWFNKKFGWEYDKICRSDRVMLTNSPSLWCYLLVLFLIISPTWLEDHLIFSNFGWPAHGLGILYSPKILGEKDLWFSYIC